MELEQYIEEAGGVVSGPDLASYLGTDPQDVRDWAEENGVPRVGNSYAFVLDTALELARDLDLLSDDADEDDDDDEDEDDGDEDEDEDEDGDDDDEDEDVDDE